MKKTIIIGVDGGGTHTRAVAADMLGNVLARAQGGGVNFNDIGMDAARENLARAVNALLEACAPAVCARVVVGLSALDAPASAQTARLFAGDALEPDALDLQSDAYTALMGVARGKPAAIAICGTGSILMLMNARGETRVRGGWGRVLGDAGSAFQLAVNGLRAAIRAWEGTGEDTALCGAALRFFQAAAPRDLIDKIYAPGMRPDAIAQFAREVLSLAETDACAARIVKDDMHELALTTRALLAGQEDVRALGLYGGVFHHSPRARKLYADAVCKFAPGVKIGPPEYPPEIGALIYAYLKIGAQSESIFSRLSETMFLQP